MILSYTTGKKLGPAQMAQWSKVLPLACCLSPLLGAFEKFTSDLALSDGFHQVFQFPPTLTIG